MFSHLSGKIFSHLQKAFVSSFLFSYFGRPAVHMVIIVTYETHGRGTH